MTTNWQLIKQAIEAKYGKPMVRSGEWWRSPSVFRDESDDNTLAIKPDPSGEWGGWEDHKTQETGSFKELASALNLTLTTNGNSGGSTLTTYRGLKDYATAQGIPLDKMVAMGWLDNVEQKYCAQHKKERPALRFKTDGGKRWRYIDGLKPKYINEWRQGDDWKFSSTWYHLDTALKVGMKYQHRGVILCNGEASAIAGMNAQLPSTTIAGGGERQIPDDLLNQLRGKIKTDTPIYICLDSDDKGRAATEQLTDQLRDAGFTAVYPIDMDLDNHGDLADFCKLHGTDSWDALQELVTETQVLPARILNHETDYFRDDKILGRVLEMVEGTRPVDFRTFPFPFPTFHKHGGFMRTCRTGKVTLIQAPSGHGKTICMETIADNLNTLGVNGMFWGAEWGSKEMMFRRIQRYAPSNNLVTTEMLANHMTWHGYKKDGVSETQNHGVRMTDEQIRMVRHLVHTVFPTIAGHTEYYGVEDMRGTDINGIFDRMRNTLARARRENEGPILFAILDYVQLMKAQPTDTSDNRHEAAFEAVKDFAKDENIHVFMTTQVNKGTTHAISDGTRDVNAADAHWIRPDKANLALALIRQYRENEKQQRLETLCFYLRMLKSNEQGSLPDGYTKPYREIELLMRPEHLRFSEVEWTTMAKYKDIIRSGS